MFQHILYLILDYQQNQETFRSHCFVDGGTFYLESTLVLGNNPNRFELIVPLFITNSQISFENITKVREHSDRMSCRSSPANVNVTKIKEHSNSMARRSNPADFKCHQISGNNSTPLELIVPVFRAHFQKWTNSQFSRLRMRQRCVT